MTDNDIIKALESCAIKHEHCTSCPFKFTDKNCDLLMTHAYGLVNRQKAEIEKLKLENRVLSQNRITMPERLEIVNNARDKAIKEFAEKIKDHCNEIVNQEWNKKTSPVSWSDAYEDFIDDIDNLILIEEMTEENENNA